MMSYTPQPIFDHRKKVQLVLPNINQKLDTSNARFVSRSQLGQHKQDNSELIQIGGRPVIKESES